MSMPSVDVPGVDIGALARYLTTALDDYDPGSELAATLLTGGRSNVTCLLSQAGSPRWVLRRPPLGHVMPSAHDMGREFDVLSRLSGSGVPTPRPRLLCSDPSVLGVTFLVYDYTPGVTIADPAAARRLTDVEAGALSREMVDTLASLHRADPPVMAAGRSASSAQYLNRQLVRWTQQWNRTRTTDLPDFGRLARWVGEEIDGLPDDYPVTWVHGDYRLDNLVLDVSTKKIKVVLDWEMSTAGDPMMDVALLLIYWEEREDRLRKQVAVARELTTPRGFWSRDQLLREYLRAAPRSATHLRACLGLACLKLAVIMESIHYRHLSGKAVDSLSSGMDSAAPALLRIGLNVAAGTGIADLSR